MESAQKTNRAGAAGGGLTKADVEKWLTDNDIPDVSVVKVLFLGNSGRGKSFLLDAAIGMKLFDHQYQPTSCTSGNNFGLYHRPNEGTYVLCNTPGLIEADSENIQRNVDCITDVFQFKPAAKTIVCFVFNEAGGRVLAEDIEGFQTIRQYAQQLRDTGFAFIINQVNPALFRSLDERVAYEAKMTAFVHELTNTRAAVHFVDTVPSFDFENYDTPHMRNLQATVVRILRELKPADVVPPAEAKLVLEREALKNEIRDLKTQMNNLGKKYEEEQRAMSQEWQNKLNAQKATFEARLADQDKIITDLKNRPPPAPVIIHQPSDCCFAPTQRIWVEHRGWVQARDVKVGDRVLTADVTYKPYFTTVYYCDERPYSRQLLTVQLDCGDGSDAQSLTLTADHLLLVLDSTEGTAPAARHRSAEHLQQGSIVMAAPLADASEPSAAVAPRRVRKVVATAAADGSVVTVLTHAGTVLAEGVLASCYQVHHYIGMLENVDLMLLYAVAPTAWLSSARVKQYARFTDDVIFRRLHSLLRPFGLGV